MNDEFEFEQWKAERNKALETLDMDYARRAMPGATNDAVMLMAMHKARYECRDISDALRHESAAWLRARGIGRLVNEPLLPEGELP